jgi:hypothetical protein
VAYLNLSVSRTAYNDAAATCKPQLKVFDMVSVAESALISQPSSCSKLLNPNQQDTLITTARTLTYDATSQFSISKPYSPSDVIRLRNIAGTIPNFRSYRNIGIDATTTINCSRVNAGTMRMDFILGTLPNLALVQIGDEIYFQPDELVFNNLLDNSYLGVNFSIVDKGSDYVVFRDNGVILTATSNLTLGSDFDSVLRLFSGTGVQIGDKVEFISGMMLDNKGTYDVIGVTDRDVLFLNAYQLDEVVININFVIYSRMLNFICITSNYPVKVKFNTNDTWLTLQEYKTGECLLLLTASVHTVFAMNDTVNQVSLTVESASY